MRCFSKNFQWQGVAAFSLVKVLVGLALVGVIALAAIRYLKVMTMSNQIVNAQADFLNVAVPLQSLIEIRLAQFFENGTDVCDDYKNMFSAVFVPTDIENENLLIELAGAMNLMAPPQVMAGVSSRLKSAWDSCVIDLPAVETGSILRFCVVFRRKSTSQSASHVGVIEPAFAKVEAKLVNAATNANVPCKSFDRDATPARVIDVRYDVFWIRRIDGNLVARAKEAQFFGSLDRGLSP